MIYKWCEGAINCHLSDNNSLILTLPSGAIANFMWEVSKLEIPISPSTGFRKVMARVQVGSLYLTWGWRREAGGEVIYKGGYRRKGGQILESEENKI